MNSLSPTGAVWRKSSRSSGAENCVEVAHLESHPAVRDSKHPTGPALVFDRGAFRALLDSVGSDC